MLQKPLMTRYYPTVVGITIVLHFVWAAGLYFDPLSALATPTHLMLMVVHTFIAPEHTVHVTSAIFVTVATLAAFGLFQTDRRMEILLILPQHFALWVSSVGAIYGMYLGQYADGVQRTHWFLIVDQIPIVLLAVGHLVALLFVAARRGLVGYG